MKSANAHLFQEVNNLTSVNKRLYRAFGVLLLALMLTAIVISGLYLKQVMERGERQLSTVLTSVIANSVSRVSFSGKYHSQLLLDDIAAKYPDILYISMIDLDGFVIASTDRQRIDTQLKSPQLDNLHLAIEREAQGVSRKYVLDAIEVLEILLAYRGGFDHAIQGVIQVGLSQHSKNSAFKKGIFYIGVLIFVLLVIGIVVVRRLSTYFGGPVQTMALDMAATLQALPDMLYELDENGRLVQILTYQQQLHVDFKQDWLGSTINEIFPESVSQTLRAALQQARADGQSHGKQYAWHTNGEEKKYELSVVRKDRVSGEAQHFIVLSRDITDAEKNRYELRKESSFRNTIIQTLPELIWLKDPDGVYLACNSMFERFFGAKQAEIVGKTDYDFVDKELADFFRQNDMEAMKAGGPRNNEEWITFADDGHRALLLTTKTPMYSDTDLVGVLGIAHDITEQRQAQEIIQQHNELLEQQVAQRTEELEEARLKAEQANIEKSRFLANMSHELRTPMHAIHSFTALALKRELDDKTRHFLANIDTSTQRLTDLLNDLLDLSKLESNKMVVSAKPHDLSDVAVKAISLLESLLQSKRLRIDKTALAAVTGSFDKKLIMQVITNLFSNAIKFSPKGSVIKVETQMVEYDQQNYLKFSIYDQGPGVPEKELETIFDAFVQSSKTMTNAGGTGLGLPISKEIVELHHGRIWGENATGNSHNSAAFHFTLPQTYQEALRYDPESFIKSHENWKLMIEAILSGVEPASRLPVEVIQNHRLCEFGKWLNSEQPKDVLSQSVYQELFQLHEQFHLSAGLLLDNYKTWDSKKLAAEISNFHDLSNRIVNVLKQQ